MNNNAKDFLETYKKIRKPLPPPSRVIPSEKDIRKNEKFDWKKELEKEEEEEDYKGIKDEQ